MINTGKSVMVDVLHGLSPSTLAPTQRGAFPIWEEPFSFMILKVQNLSNLESPGPTCNGHGWTTLELQYPTLYKPQHTPVVRLTSILIIAPNFLIQHLLTTPSHVTFNSNHLHTIGFTLHLLPIVIFINLTLTHIAFFKLGVLPPCSSGLELLLPNNKSTLIANP